MVYSCPLPHDLKKWFHMQEMLENHWKSSKTQKRGFCGTNFDLRIATENKYFFYRFEILGEAPYENFRT
eukprot:scaffold871_cov130-Cylindrotheca_fusiformis.AAC.33